MSKRLGVKLIPLNSGALAPSKRKRVTSLVPSKKVRKKRTVKVKNLPSYGPELPKIWKDIPIAEGDRLITKRECPKKPKSIWLLSVDWLNRSKFKQEGYRIVPRSGPAYKAAHDHMDTLRSRAIDGLEVPLVKKGGVLVPMQLRASAAEDSVVYGSEYEARIAQNTARNKAMLASFDLPGAKAEYAKHMKQPRRGRSKGVVISELQAMTR